MKIKSVIGLLILSLFFYSCEYFETKKKVEQKKNELKNLSDKFRELKSF